MLSHLEQQSCSRLLFVDCILAFNTIIPDILIPKMNMLIKDFLSNRPQTVRIGPHFSTWILSTGVNLGIY
ncbi:unnamed protein product, partial [Menidia menidia]